VVLTKNVGKASSTITIIAHDPCADPFMMQTMDVPVIDFDYITPAVIEW
jgi:hypothetical protein